MNGALRSYAANAPIVEEVSTPPQTASLDGAIELLAKEHLLAAQSFRYWVVILLSKDYTKYAIFLRELDNKIPKIQFTTKHYAPQSLYSVVIVVVVYKSFLSHFLVLDQSWNQKDYHQRNLIATIVQLEVVICSCLQAVYSETSPSQIQQPQSGKKIKK
jgi:hypothetical protein